MVDGDDANGLSFFVDTTTYNASTSSSFVTNHNNGTYTLTYIAPTHQYTITTYLNGRVIAASTISPYDQLDNSTTSASSIVVYVLCVVSMLLVLGYIEFVIRRRGDPSVKASSPAHLVTMLVAGCLALVSTSTLVLASTSSVACGAMPVLLGVAATTMIAALLVKTWRIMKIFTTSNLAALQHMKAIKGVRLAIPVVVMVVVELLIDVLWVSIDPMQPKEVGSSIVVRGCSPIHPIYAHTTSITYTLTLCAPSIP